MGTLYNQTERNYHPVSFNYVRSSCEELKKIAKEMNMSIADVIEIYKIEVMDRVTACKVDDGDRKDEQLAGFGEIAKSISESVEKAVEILDAVSANTNKTSEP